MPTTEPTTDLTKVPLTSLIALLHAPEWSDQRARGEGVEVRRFGNEVGVLEVEDDEDWEGEEREVVRLAAYHSFSSSDEARQWLDDLILASLAAEDD